MEQEQDLLNRYRRKLIIQRAGRLSLERIKKLLQASKKAGGGTPETLKKGGIEH